MIRRLRNRQVLGHLVEPAARQAPVHAQHWSLTFTWAATATSALHWLHDRCSSRERLYEYLTAAVITVLHRRKSRCVRSRRSCEASS